MPSPKAAMPRRGGSMRPLPPPPPKSPIPPAPPPPLASSEVCSWRRSTSIRLARSCVRPSNSCSTSHRYGLGRCSIRSTAPAAMSVSWRCSVDSRWDWPGALIDGVPGVVVVGLGSGCWSVERALSCTPRRAARASTGQLPYRMPCTASVSASDLRAAVVDRHDSSWAETAETVVDRAEICVGRGVRFGSMLVLLLVVVLAPRGRAGDPPATSAGAMPASRPIPKPPTPTPDPGGKWSRAGAMDPTVARSRWCAVKRAWTSSTIFLAAGGRLE
mmetsp:Transcript_27689/g.64954  ORF Transcript_27689/g.64954 Transcript_27689/m.64954 type:complete len:273 (-) Transcript_27689:328-1146(-)